MGMLSKKEKEELKKSSKSLKLRKDFRSTRNNSLTKKGKIDLDDFIKFLTITNALIDNRPKPFKKIEGDNFAI